MAQRFGDPERASLGPGMTTFVVVDVILVLTFFALLALLSTGPRTAPLASGSTSSSSAPPPEASPATTALAAPTDAERLATFVLPSGNIWCAMTETTATCTILKYTFTPPDIPAGCTGTVGNVLMITATDSPKLGCVTGDPQPAPAGTPTLEYGQASTVGEMTCHSSTNGATCRHNPTGSGFSVARGGYTFF